MCEVSQRGEEEIFLIGSFKFMEITLQDAIDDDRSEWVLVSCPCVHLRREMFVNFGIVNFCKHVREFKFSIFPNFYYIILESS